MKQQCIGNEIMLGEEHWDVRYPKQRKTWQCDCHVGRSVGRDTVGWCRDVDSCPMYTLTDALKNETGLTVNVLGWHSLKLPDFLKTHCGKSEEDEAHNHDTSDVFFILQVMSNFHFEPIEAFSNTYSVHPELRGQSSDAEDTDKIIPPVVWTKNSTLSNKDEILRIC